MRRNNLGNVKVGSLYEMEFAVNFIGTNREKLIMITAYLYGEQVFRQLNLGKCDSELIESALWQIDAERFAFLLNYSDLLIEVISELIVLNKWNIDFDIETLSFYTDDETYHKMTTVNKAGNDAFLDYLWCLPSGKRTIALNNMILMSM